MGKNRMTSQEEKGNDVTGKKGTHRAPDGAPATKNQGTQGNRPGAIKYFYSQKYVICPPFHRYLQNTYQKPAKLVIPGENNNYDIILSEEGTTQGDVAAMALYGLGIKPLTDRLSRVVDKSLCKKSLVRRVS